MVERSVRVPLRARNFLKKNSEIFFQKISFRSPIGRAVSELGSDPRATGFESSSVRRRVWRPDLRLEMLHAQSRHIYRSRLMSLHEFHFSEFLLFLAFFALFLYQSHNLILGPPETYRGVCAPEGNLLSMSDPPDQTSRSAKERRSLSDFFSPKRHKSDTASSSSASSSSSSSASSATSPLSSSSSPPSSAHHVPGTKQTINDVDSDKDTYSKSFLSVLKQLVDNTEANHEMMEARFAHADSLIEAALDMYFKEKTSNGKWNFKSASGSALKNAGKVMVRHNTEKSKLKFMNGN